MESSALKKCIEEVKKIKKLSKMLDETKGSLRYQAQFIPWMPLQTFVNAVSLNKFDNKLLSKIFNIEMRTLSQKLKELINISKKHIEEINSLTTEQEALQKWIDDIDKFQSNLKSFKSSDDEVFFNRKAKISVACGRDGQCIMGASPLSRCPSHGITEKFSSCVSSHVPFCMDSEVSA